MKSLKTTYMIIVTALFIKNKDLCLFLQVILNNQYRDVFLINMTK